MSNNVVIGHGIMTTKMKPRTSERPDASRNTDEMNIYAQTHEHAKHESYWPPNDNEAEAEYERANGRNSQDRQNTNQMHVMTRNRTTIERNNQDCHGIPKDKQAPRRS